MMKLTGKLADVSLSLCLSFGLPHVLFVLCKLGHFPLWFSGSDFGSDCISSSPLLMLYFIC